jgi:hypothetical protein
MSVIKPCIKIEDNTYKIPVPTNSNQRREIRKLLSFSNPEGNATPLPIFY